MDYISFVFKEFGSSEIVFILITIAIVWLYRTFIKPPIDELKEYKKGLKSKIDLMATKEEVIDAIKSYCSDNEIIDTFNNSYENIINEIQKITTNSEKDHIDLKNDLVTHHEELTSVREIIDTISKNCTALYEVTDKTLLQLEAKGLIDKLERVDYQNLNKIQVTANELSVLASLLKDTFNKSEQPRKLNRV